uniref:Envelope glycoprotein H n=1 Tax=Elephant endotheliotropic herpesvirus 1B TaxID=759754 RepID=E2IL73_ELHV1|nr:envelope glycoprotein H [Elephant endotheliotropic herpesvirus 1B]
MLIRRRALWLTIPILIIMTSHKIMCAFDLSHVHSESCLKIQDISSDTINFTPNLVMFRFFSNETHSDVFHLPKCIFDSKLTSYLFDHLNIYEDVSVYKNNFEKYYMGSVEGTYRTIIIKGEDTTPYLDKTTAPTVEITEKDLIITYQGIRYMNPFPVLSLIDDESCEVFDDINELILPYFGKCRKFYLNFGSVTLFGHITSNFVTIKYTAQNGTDPYTIRLFFGNSAEIVHTLPFEAQDLALRMMMYDDFEIIGEVGPVKEMLKSFKLSLLDSLLEQNHEDVMNDFRHVFEAFYNHIKKIRDGSIDIKSLHIEQLLDPLLTYSIGYYIQYRYPPYTGKWRGIEHFIETETYIHMVPELFDLFAHNMTVKTPTRPNAIKFINILIRLYSYTDYTKLDHRGLSLYFLKYIYQGNVTDDIATYAHRYMTNLYTKYTYPKTQEGEHLYKSYNDSLDTFILNTIGLKSKNKTLLHHILLLQTGMCNIQNIIGHFHSLQNNDPKFGALLSPCYRSLRYDLTAKKIGQLITKESLEPYGRLVNMVRFMTKNSSMLNVLKCELPEDDGLLAIATVDNKTYIISSRPIAVGVVYKATYTAINLFLYVTRIQNNTCIHIDKVYRDGDVKAVYTFSLDTAKDCGDMCPSVLVEYQTNTGFIGIHVINSIADIQYISENRNLFPESSHYLWLLKNDTVLELEGTNFFLFSSKSPGAIVLYIIIISLIAWTLYEIIKLFCYKRQWQYQKL